MSNKISKIKGVLKKELPRVAGKVVEKNKESITVKMGQLLLEISNGSIVSEDKANDDIVIFTLEADADILVTSITPIDDLVSTFSSNAINERPTQLNVACECCDCCQCCYCCYCTECCYCTSYGMLLNPDVSVKALQLGQGRDLIRR